MMQIILSSGAKFFSLQADGSTDAGNIEDELFLVLTFDPHTKDGKVHVHDRFLTVRQTKSGNAEGLFECFKNALSYVGVANWEDKLIGFGCDGTSVNIAAGGLRGYLEQSVPWQRMKLQSDIGHFPSICGTCLNKNRFVPPNCPDDKCARP